MAAVNQDVSFNVLVTGESPMSFQWFLNGQPIQNETNSTLIRSHVQASDDRSEFFVRVTDASGVSLQSDTVVLSIFSNTAPVPMIVAPDPSLQYVAGEEYSFTGMATDAEDGELSASAFDWQIVFHHDEHTHPFMPQALGITEGLFVPPTNDETSANVWYRIHLTVTDSAGTATTVKQDVFPLVSDVSVQSVPAGLELLIDGSPQTAPVNFEGVAGVARVLEAPETQVINGETWIFSSWSNGGDRTQTLTTPLVDSIFVATYELQQADLPPVAGLTSPSAVAVETVPLTISGVASDEVGINAVLDTPDAAQTAWSYTLTPSVSTDIQVIAQARQAGGLPGEKESVVFTLQAADIPAEPSVVITSPLHKANEPNPVTMQGTADLDSLTEVKLVIKQRGARNYWNGTTWQSARVEIDATLNGNQWHYVLTQPQPRNVVIRAFAVNIDGTRIASKRVMVDIE